MLEIGSVIDGKYKILSKIGQGGMSVVYMALNEKANKTWAIKEIRRDGVENFQVVQQNLLAETDLLKELNHPNLPSIVDVIEDRDTFLIVMDYIEGNPLSDTLREFGAQPQEVVIDWAKQLCDVLGYLHGQTPAIVYRDLKPANVMLTPNGTLKLIDFGTARRFKEKNLEDTTCLGTIGYAAPEQFGGQGQTDGRTDIYCLGATRYHLVTGANPAEPPYEMVPVRKLNASLSGGLENIILKCTRQNPAERYQSCAELAYQLEHYEEVDDKYRKRQKRRLGAFITTTALSILLGAASLFFYVFAQGKMGENYDLKLEAARDMALPWEDRARLYKEAVNINMVDTRAYLGLVDLFTAMESEEGEKLTKNESSVLIQLKAGLDVQGTGGIFHTIYPLQGLRERNPEGYAQVCREVGMAYWYAYELKDSDERHIAALDWLRGGQGDPVADTFAEIAGCEQEIKKYAGQFRTEKMYETYNDLWLRLEVLRDVANDLEENSDIVKVWSQIVAIISEKEIYFLSSRAVTKEDMIAFLEGIQAQTQTIYGQYKDTQMEEIKRQFTDLDAAVLRVLGRAETVDEPQFATGVDEAETTGEGGGS